MDLWDAVNYCTNGKFVGKQRKKRSDAGVKHKCVDDSSDNLKENERVESKKQKVTRQRKDSSAKKATMKKLQATTSCEYISDSEMDEHSPTEDDKTDWLIL